MTMVIVSGGIDLSVGSVVAMSTVVTAVALRTQGPAAAAAAAIVAGAMCGLVNGLLVTQLRVVPFIVTLGTMLLVRGAAKGLADERRIEAPVTWLNSLLRTARDGSGLWLPTGIWITVALAVLVGLTLRYTRFGRHLFAIGSSERTARLCGVRIGRTKIAVYTIAGMLAALAGILEFSKLSVGDPTVSNGLELDVIAAVIIGVGTRAGAAIMAVIQIGCSQLGLPNWVQQIVTGSIIVGAVALDRLRS
jgi:ribose/xylose/arabinose/galactoside ABC-type transport system permease subunit